MKKTYIEPKLVAMTIGVSQVICSSLTLGGKASESGVTSADARQGILDFENE